MNEDLDRVVTFGRALSHIVRVELLPRYGREEPASPSDVADATSIASLNTVNYHTLQLVECGALELAGKRPVKGGFEHFYRLTRLGTEIMHFAAAIAQGSADDRLSMGRYRSEPMPFSDGRNSNSDTTQFSN